MLKHFKYTILLATLGIVFVNSLKNQYGQEVSELNGFPRAWDQYSTSRPPSVLIFRPSSGPQNSFRSLLGSNTSQSPVGQHQTKTSGSTIIQTDDDPTNMDELLKNIEAILIKSIEEQLSNSPSIDTPEIRLCCDDDKQLTDCKQLPEREPCDTKLVDRENSIYAPTADLLKNSWSENQLEENYNGSQQPRSSVNPGSFGSSTPDDDYNSESREMQRQSSNSRHNQQLPRSSTQFFSFNNPLISDLLPTEAQNTRRNETPPSSSRRPSYSDYRQPSSQNSNIWGRLPSSSDAAYSGYGRESEPRNNVQEQQSRAKSKGKSFSRSSAAEPRRGLFSWGTKKPPEKPKANASPTNSQNSIFGQLNLLKGLLGNRGGERTVEDPGDQRPSISNTGAPIKYPKDAKYKKISLKEFREHTLDRHNYYRKKHGLQKFRSNKQLNETSQKYAEHLASTDPGGPDMPHSPMDKRRYDYGENLYWACGRINNVGHYCTDRWWAEIEFIQPGCPIKDIEDMDAVGHATQMLWSKSIYLGCGIARTKDGHYYVVCHYSPSGNRIGGDHYFQNLPRFKEKEINEAKKLSEYLRTKMAVGIVTLSNYRKLTSEEESVDYENEDIAALLRRLTGH